MSIIEDFVNPCVGILIRANQQDDLTWVESPIRNSD